MVRDQLVDEGPAQFDLGRHVDDFELRVLELGQRPAEGRALLAVLDRDLQHVFGGRHRADRADEPLLLKLQHQLQEARPLVAEPVRLRNPAVGEVELRRVLAVPADLLDLFPLFEAGRARLDKEEVDRGVRVLGRGIAGRQDQQVAVDPVADEGLLAVENDLAARFDRRRLDRGQIAPGVRLGHRDRRDDVAGHAAGQVFPFLLFGRERHDIRNDDVTMQRGSQARVVRPDQLFGDDDRVEEVRPKAAVLLGNAHREKSLSAHLLPGLARDDPRLLPFLDMRGDFAREKPFQHIAEHPVFIGVLQNFHGGPPWSEN